MSTKDCADWLVNCPCVKNNKCVCLLSKVITVVQNLWSAAVHWMLLSLQLSGNTNINRLAKQRRVGFCN